MMDRLHEIMHSMLAWVEGLASTPYGGWALFAIAFAESSFFPVPPDVLLIALCLGRPELSFFFAAVCSIASVLGGILGYGIGFYGGRPVLKRFFDDDKVAAVERYYDRYNAWATGIAGLTPLPYKIFTITGGVFAVRFKIFVIASILARSLRFFIVAGLVYFFGESIKTFIDQYLPWLTVLFVVCLVAGYWLFARQAKRVAAGHDAATTVEHDG